MTEPAAGHPQRLRVPHRPPKVREQHRGATAYARFNTRIAVAITRGVGSVSCAYLFVILALVALPDAIEAGLYAVIVWLSTALLQLVLLPLIMVGQAVQSKAADARAEATFHDTEALLAQGRELAQRVDRLGDQVHELARAATAVRAVEAQKRPSADDRGDCD